MSSSLEEPSLQNLINVEVDSMGPRGFFSRFHKPIFRKKGTQSLPSKTVQMDMVSKFSAGMSTYALACQTDPDLKSFDLSLHEQTNEVISSLAAHNTGDSLSLDSLVRVWRYLLFLNQRLVKLIIDCKEDVLKNKDLRSLVDVYFNSTTKTLDLCNSVEKSAKKVEIGHLIIRYAVKLFEKESLGAHDTDLGENKKYAKTLEELNKFKAMGDPFNNDSFTQFQSVYEQQLLLVQDLGKKRENFGKKQRNVKTFMMLLNGVFVTASVSVLVLSVVGAAARSPSVATALAGALTTPVGYVGTWFKKMWVDYEKAQSGLALSLERGTIVSVEAVETIRTKVDKLRIMIESVHQKVEFAVEREEEEEALGLAMQELKDMVEEFCRKIKEVGVIADRCSACIATGRVTVIAHIASFSTE